MAEWEHSAEIVTAVRGIPSHASSPKAYGKYWRSGSEREADCQCSKVTNPRTLALKSLKN